MAKRDLQPGDRVGIQFGDPLFGIVLSGNGCVYVVKLDTGEEAGFIRGYLYYAPLAVEVA